MVFKVLFGGGSAPGIGPRITILGGLFNANQINLEIGRCIEKFSANLRPLGQSFLTKDVNYCEKKVNDGPCIRASVRPSSSIRPSVCPSVILSTGWPTGILV